MISHSNIDRTDAAFNTKAPFEYTCALKLGDYTLPEGAFLSIRIQLDETFSPPAHIYKFTVIDDVLTMTFCDKAFAPIGEASFKTTTAALAGYPYCSTPILNANGVLVGTVAMQQDAISRLIGIVRQLSNGVAYTTSKDFTLLPQCHILAFAGQARCISINGNITTDNVTIAIGDYIRNTGNGLFIDIGGVFVDTTPTNYITSLVVGNTTLDVSNKHILIKASVCSNLRTHQEGSTLRLVGVADEQ